MILHCGCYILLLFAVGCNLVLGAAHLQGVVLGDSFLLPCSTTKHISSFSSLLLPVFLWQHVCLPVFDVFAAKNHSHRGPNSAKAKEQKLKSVLQGEGRYLSCYMNKATWAEFDEVVAAQTDVIRLRTANRMRSDIFPLCKQKSWALDGLKTTQNIGRIRTRYTASSVGNHTAASWGKWCRVQTCCC